MMHDAGGARFSFAGQIAGIPIIHDQHGRRSVTVAAEAVVAAVIDLCHPHGRYVPRAIIYRDSAGVFDAIRIERGAFAGFILVNANSDAEAFNRISDEIARPPPRLYASPTAVAP